MCRTIHFEEVIATFRDILFRCRELPAYKHVFEFINAPECDKEFAVKLFQKLNATWFITCEARADTRKKRDSLIKYSKTPDIPYNDICFIHCIDFLGKSPDEQIKAVRFAFEQIK